jgi:uroporphyrinogen decarboxylase
MNKIERVRAALVGAPVDHPPLTLWYHFGLQHAPADRTVQAHLDFFEAYDFDWLKVMNDYSYPMPDGIETLDRAADLTRVVPLDLERTPLATQLDVIERLARSLRGRALVVDTMFNAWNTLKRNVVNDAMGVFMREHGEALDRALAAVNRTLIDYAHAAFDRGAAGIFLSVPATSESLTRAEFERFMRPHDLALLNAVHGRDEMTVLHAHGGDLYLDRLLDYPVRALSWADRDSGPSLATMRAQTALPLIGGLTHTHFAYASAATLRAQVREAIAATGGRGLFLAPGCAIPTYSFPELIRAVRDESHRPR